MSRLRIKDNTFVSIEHPGILKSVENGCATLGGLSTIQQATERAAKNPKNAVLELRMRPNDNYEHPVQARLRPKNNILVRVHKQNGKAQCLGRIKWGFNFRNIADFQYNTSKSEFLSRVDSTLRTLDYETVPKFYISLQPAMRESLDVPPPPVFSQTVIPHHYNYLQNPHVGRISLPDGKSRLVNLRGAARIWTIMIGMDAERVPTERHAEVKKEPNAIVQDVLKELAPLFEKRPMWTRRGILENISAASHSNLKYALPYVSYLWASGPFRDAFTRFGYDPRKDSVSAKYQTLFFKFKVNEEHTGSGSYIFDGTTLYPKTRIYQICDITDPLVKSLLQDAPLHSTCHPTEGWYKSGRLNKVRDVMREKLRALTDGRCLSEEALSVVLAAPERDESEHNSPSEEEGNSTSSFNASSGFANVQTDARVNELMRNLMKQSEEHESFEDIEDYDEFEDVFGD
ncbi:transcription factor tfiiic complex a box associated subunit sfc1 [Schizosaccharomyces japonicus yFS275]|uniref:Transcription factor tfiiic complex a box associated subunit sfc1 n=1 Tax=Schizosaccharomyces japonicus (strain yFS275 / FY16936) TaxID=402676 RepID=B6K407_SCHJY|nr:transcription factor tfiiic complex a box associated subunit sfc1 [Schizosaccharomyces japonicus yFS275]EEB08214.2 transcription factor tfiiic complex a box associated subunit sfc1 [Schizosaccharomyces japonicus yFS275]